MDGMIDIEAAVQPVAAAPSSLRWYALQTHPAREYRVRRWLAAGEVDPEDSPRRLVPMVARDFRSKHGLDRMGYEMWLPECVIITSYRRNMIVRNKCPWFPGYLFIRLDITRGWRGLEEVDGVAGLLLDAGRPRALADARIAGLRGECDAETGLAVIELSPQRQFKKDQRLRVTGGPFVTFEGLYSERADERIKVMLDIFGRQTGVWLDEAQVEPVS
jgi:transcriptional antiterminator RfaH